MNDNNLLCGKRFYPQVFFVSRGQPLVSLVLVTIEGD